MLDIVEAPCRFAFEPTRARFDMSVHYKFKSSLDFDTITFDGLHISVNDFRKAVVQQKRLGKTNDFELQITNAQTKEEYENENDLIPKNTSLIISRIPQTSKKQRDSLNQNTPSVCHVAKFDSNTLDLSQMNASEEDKIQAMMAQSTVDYDPRGYQKIRGPGQTGEVPPTYRCYKCHQTGHWIKNCPLPHTSSKKSEIRRNTGIPKSFLQEKGVEKISTRDEIVVVGKQAEVPDELLCSICKDIFRDAVMIPCCGSSFCDDCVRTALLESEENECPDCKEKGTSPGSLIPNRFLRSSVNTFKNETGYERKRKNNGVHEVVTSLTEHVSEITSNIDATSTEVPENNNLVENSVPTSLDVDSTPPKLSTEIEDSISLKKEDVESIKPEDKEERQQKSVEPSSPKQRVEVVVPQRETSHNSDVQTRPEDTFKQTNPSAFTNYGPSVPDLPHRSNTTDSYPVRSDSFMRHAKQNQGIVPAHMGYCNNYGNRTERYYYPRDSYNINAAPYPFLPNTRCRQVAPHSNIQPYYQGMSGTIEPGIIEDPLEAFNRIMKEKEKRKQMKRLDSDRHRSVVVKRNPRDPSPINEKRSRHRVSPVNERRNRSPLRQEKLSSHRIIERDKNIRSHRSHYASNKRSFSRSNSPPQRRYSKSPRRRSRSRSHPRSHSREIDSIRHGTRSSKHVLVQSHRTDYDKDGQRYSKKPAGRFSETRSVSETGPKENRRHNSKIKENGNQIFDNYTTTASRKAFLETDNVQECRDMRYDLPEKKSRATFSKSDDAPKVDKRSRGNDSVQSSEIPPKQEIEKKNKDRKKKKEKDEKTDRKSKKEKKEKKKRERHKEEQKKHPEHKKTREELDSTSSVNIKESDDSRNQIRVIRKDNFKSSYEESLDDKNETFTPDINITRNIEVDHIIDDIQKEGTSRLSEENSVFKTTKSPAIFKDERYKQCVDNNCSELNTPTSFVDTTPENYAGKWDNFDFSMPNSEDMKGDNDRDGEYDSNLFHNCSPSLRNDQFGGIRNINKKKNFFIQLHQLEEKKLKNEDILKERRSDLTTKVTSRRSSPTPSEAMSSSSNNSIVGKASLSKKRRKKSKHKKEKQHYKRSSSAESSKNSRKSASKHKKNKSEKKKKNRRNESR